MHEITLQHSIDAAHRVVGHDGKCARLHGHTYGFEVTVRAGELMPIGFVVDFAIIKEAINEWDHRTILWDQDPLTCYLQPGPQLAEDLGEAEDDAGVVRVPFNPTAEAMAEFMAEVVLRDSLRLNPSVYDVSVGVAETPKSYARAEASHQSIGQTVRVMRNGEWVNVPAGQVGTAP